MAGGSIPTAARPDGGPTTGSTTSAARGLQGDASWTARPARALVSRYGCRGCRAGGTSGCRCRTRPRGRFGCWWSTITRSCARAWCATQAARGVRGRRRGGQRRGGDRQARRFQPDIVIMDVRLPGRQRDRGLSRNQGRAARDAGGHAHLATRTRRRCCRAIVAGASGYLLKQVRARDLVAALEAVGRGESLLDPAVTEKVLERDPADRHGDVDRRAGAADRAGAEDPAARRRGQDQQGDRGRDVPVRQDGQELRQLDPGQAQPRASRQAAAFVAKHRLDRGGGGRGPGGGGRPRRLGARIECGSRPPGA